MNDVYTVLPFKDAFYYFLLNGDQLRQTLAFLTKNKQLRTSSCVVVCRRVMCRRVVVCCSHDFAGGSQHGASAVCESPP